MKPGQVRNRAPNPIQISAEQLVRDARDRHLEDMPKLPEQYIEDNEELEMYQREKRKDFEGQIMRSRTQIGLWLRYARWEADQKEFERSRSVFERALDVDYKNDQLWLKYAEMEMKNKFINHARNIYDRAVTLLPRMDVFWLKYTYMEEMVGAVAAARNIFERWMKWEPDDNGWISYIKFCMRQGDIAAARDIYERFISCHPISSAYLKYAKWEEKHKEYVRSRHVYERSLESVHHDESTEDLMLAFARFEERCHEIDRARVIFKFALDSLQGESSSKGTENDHMNGGNLMNNDGTQEMTVISRLKQEYIAFEKRNGSKEYIDNAMLVNRRSVYTQRINNNANDYDTWLDWCNLEETEGSILSARNIYEKAIENIPSKVEKKSWRRYIYIWIYYAIFEELKAKDINRARSVYKRCLDTIPHHLFTFGKIWIMAAHLEIRCRDVTAARKLFGNGIGRCMKHKIFKSYIEMELQLGEVDRCRTIYTKYLESFGESNKPWLSYAKLECDVGELERCRAIYELAISQPTIDMPEMIWKAYIDYEVDQAEGNKARALYYRLLDRTQHVKVYIALARFEMTPCGGGTDVARKVFEDAYKKLKEMGLKEERVVLIDEWIDFEKGLGQQGDVAKVHALVPKKVKMRRAVPGGDGHDTTYEEYYEYTFPDDEKKMPGLKILENAMKWKQAMKAMALAKSQGAEGINANDEPEKAVFGGMLNAQSLMEKNGGVMEGKGEGEDNSTERQPHLRIDATMMDVDKNVIDIDDI
jgi:crooked neck